MMAMLPPRWLQDSPTHLDMVHQWEAETEKQVQQRGDDEEIKTMKKGFKDYHAVFVAGAKDASVHAGLECCGLANLRVVAS